METEILTTIDDPDLGKLDLVREHFRAKSADDPVWRDLSILEWRGKHRSENGLSFDISVYADEDTVPAQPDVADIARATFRRLIGDEAGFRRIVAAQQIELAVDWASEAGDIPLPTLESFTRALSLETVQFHPGRITFWYHEDRDIFAGHALEVRLDPDGRISEICLAG